MTEDLKGVYILTGKWNRRVQSINFSARNLEKWCTICSNSAIEIFDGIGKKCLSIEHANGLISKYFVCFQINLNLFK